MVQTLGNVLAGPFDSSLVPDPLAGAAGFRPVPNRTAYRIEGLVMRRGPSPDALRAGWRLIYGIFRIDGAPHYALLALSPDLAITHVWPITDSALGVDRQQFAQAQYPHGFILLPDASVVVAFDGDYHTTRLDVCGRRIWSSPARLHHALYAVDDGRSAWGVGEGYSLQQIDLGDGRLLRTITMDQLRAANPGLGALEMQRLDDNALGTNRRDDAQDFPPDAYHVNDVEPLPAALASAFPHFRAGDLLVSFRSLNMLAVIDPATRAVRWMTNDYTLRQHDGNWNTDGTITVLDNNMGRRFSRILRFRPAAGTHDVLLDGQSLDFYTRIRGKHQLLPGGGLLVTSSQQGRIFERGPDSRIALELLVRDPAHPGRNFVVSEARFLPSDSLPMKKVTPCQKSSSSSF
ncbi:MAG: hypothetical protein J0I80_11505 [Sphingomonas sp.]|nr:hypothetical protein [Sphingomonas sp.]